jgi:hypothetical protein
VTGADLRAANITVTTTDDSRAGSLREALANVADGDTIDFAVTGTILLTSGELLVTNSVDIAGPGATDVAVNGSGASRVFRIGPGIVVAISGLTITNGATSGAFPGDRGGGILVERSSLTVSNCAVSGNSASQDGGGLYNNAFSGTATLQIVNSTVSGNSALNGNGGGIASNGELGSAMLWIANSTIVDNSAGNLGGGVLNQGDSGRAILQIDSTSLTGNTAQGGGGIGNMGGALTINSSTLNENVALNGDGGGITSFGQLQSSTTAQIVNSTLSGNSATKGSGGAIANAGAPRASASVRIVHSTLSGNSAGGSPRGGGGGIANTSLFGGSAMVAMGDTILNAGAAGENIFNSSGTVVSLGYNLSSDAGGGVLIATGDQVNTDPMLGPLQDNGGPTLTHALLADSPAIDAGDPNFTTPPDFDQRGPGFPRVVGGRIDIGAFEAPEAIPPVITQIRDLIALVRSMPIHNAIKHELITRLHKARIAANVNKDFKACSAMRAFISLVHDQAGKKLTPDQATRLLDGANRIRAMLGCP